MSIIQLLNYLPVLICLTGLMSAGCGQAPSAGDPATQEVDGVTLVNPTDEPSPDPEPEPVLVPIVQASPTPGPSASPTPVAAALPITTDTWSDRKICWHLRTLDLTQNAVKLISSSNGYYYLFSAQSVTLTTLPNGPAGADGVTETVGEVVLIFKNQLNTSPTSCTINVQSGQITSIQ